MIISFRVPKAEGVTQLHFYSEGKEHVIGISNLLLLLKPGFLITCLGERPMNIEWGLQEAIPAEILSITKVIL